MMLALGGLALPRTQPNALIAAEDTNINEVAQLLKPLGLGAKVMQAAVDGVLETLDDTRDTLELNAQDTPACTAALGVVADTKAGYKEAKKAFTEAAKKFHSVCSGSKAEKEVVMVDDAFKAVGDELRTLLTSKYGMTAEQAEDTVQAGHEAAALAIDLAATSEELEQAKGDCAAARTEVQAAKRAVKKARLAKKNANIDKSCKCHPDGSGCPFKHGDVVLIKNMYNHIQSYLDSCGGASCVSSKYGVLTHDTVRATTTTWKIHRLEGEGHVMDGDELHLQNLYLGDGGWLDACGGAQCSDMTKYSMQTSTEPDRQGGGTGTWKVIKGASERRWDALLPGDVFHLQNKYASYGTYLDTCGGGPGGGCSTSRYSVSTMSVPERCGAKHPCYTGAWKFIKYDAQKHKFEEAAEATQMRMAKAANLVQRTNCGADDPYCMKLILQNVTATP